MNICPLYQRYETALVTIVSVHSPVWQRILWFSCVTSCFPLPKGRRMHDAGSCSMASFKTGFCFIYNTSNC